MFLAQIFISLPLEFTSTCRIVIPDFRCSSDRATVVFVFSPASWTDSVKPPNSMTAVITPAIVNRPVIITLSIYQDYPDLSDVAQIYFKLRITIYSSYD